MAKIGTLSEEGKHGNATTDETVQDGHVGVAVLAHVNRVGDELNVLGHLRI